MSSVLTIESHIMDVLSTITAMVLTIRALLWTYSDHIKQHQHPSIARVMQKQKISREKPEKNHAYYYVYQMLRGNLLCYLAFCVSMLPPQTGIFINDHKECKHWILSAMLWYCLTNGIMIYNQIVIIEKMLSSSNNAISKLLILRYIQYVILLLWAIAFVFYTTYHSDDEKITLIPLQGGHRMCTYDRRHPSKPIFTFLSWSINGSLHIVSVVVMMTNIELTHWVRMKQIFLVILYNLATLLIAIFDQWGASIDTLWQAHWAVVIMWVIQFMCSWGLYHKICKTRNMENAESGNENSNLPRYNQNLPKQFTENHHGLDISKSSDWDPSKATTESDESHSSTIGDKVHDHSTNMNDNIIRIDIAKLSSL